MTTVTVPSGTDSIVFLDEEGAIVSMTDASGVEFYINEDAPVEPLPEPYLLAGCNGPGCRRGKNGKCYCPR